MAYKRTPAAERKKYKVVIICLTGGCFTADGETLPGAPGFSWKQERIVYVYEAVDPLARVKMEERLVLEGFRPVDGDQINIFSKRRPRVSNPEFWDRVLMRAQNLGGVISIIGSESSSLFRYLLENPKVSKKVPRIVASFEAVEGGCSLEHRQMIAMLTSEVLYPRCMVGYELDRDKHTHWTEGLLKTPEVFVDEGSIWLVLPDLGQSWQNPNSAEGQFAKAMIIAGYEIRPFTGKVAVTAQTDRKTSFLAVRLKPVED